MAIKSKNRSWPARIAWGVAKTLGAVVLAVVVLIVTTLAFFFAIPEFKVTSENFRTLIAKYAPETVAVKFDHLDLSIVRPTGLPFAKRITLVGGNVCVRYNGEAVDSCLGNINLELEGGWGGERNETEAWYMPSLIRLAPIQLTGISAEIDLGKFPSSQEEETSTSSIDYIELLRTKILPKWEVEGSRLELKHFVLKMEDGSGYSAKFDLAPGARGETIVAKLEELKSLDEALRVQAEIKVKRPEGWVSNAMSPAEDIPRSQNLPAVDSNDIAQKPKSLPPTKTDRWAVELVSQTSLSKGKQKINLSGDARIATFSDLDFRIRTLIKGITGVEEVRLEGDMVAQRAQGLISVRAGKIGNQVQALDFANCAWRVFLDEKTGAVRCGPQTVRLKLKDYGQGVDKKLFVLAPEIDLNIRNLNFGDVKSADAKLVVALDHFNLLSFKTDINANVRSSEELEYSAQGTVDFNVAQFQNLVKLLRATPYSVPAPVNQLDGLVGTKVNFDVQNGNGFIDLTALTRLDSDFQAIHIDLTARTELTKTPKTVVPKTRADLSIGKLNLSVPRLELAVPPPFTPDSRFGPINEQVIAELINPHTAADDGDPMDFKLRIHTAPDTSVRLATNMTKNAIPITLDVTYDAQVAAVKARAPENKTSASNVVTTPGVQSDVRTLAKEELDKSVQPEELSPITGWVIVGRTPVDLFRRNAVLEELRIDLLRSGDNRMNGRVSVNYLEYQINMILAGQVSSPQIRFVSDPVLEDDQILAVLLFGRPMEDLGEDEKSSVGNLNAAFTDAVLGVSSLYLLASTPIESVGYDPESEMVTARVGLGGGAALVVGSGGGAGSGVGIRKRLTKDLSFRSDIETIGATGKRTVSALVEWVKKF